MWVWRRKPSRPSEWLTTGSGYRQPHGPDMTTSSPMPAIKPSNLLALILLPALILALGLAPPTPSYAQEAVSLTGRVVNGTDGGAATSGLRVLLLVIDHIGGLVFTGEATTEDKGEFEIVDVPVVTGGRYILDVEYEGTPYQDVITEEQLQGSLLLTVYDTTTDVSVIRLSRQVMVITGIDAQKMEITAIEFVRLTNPGDRTVVPDLTAGTPMGFLRFTLPPQTTGLNVNSDLPSREIIAIGTGFAVTSPITPGDHSIEFTYRFPYEGSLLSYRQNLLQGAEIYQVMAPQDLIQLQVRPLVPVEPVNIQGTPYKVWQAIDLAPREGFLLELAKLPRPSLVERMKSSIGSTGFWMTGIPALMGVVLASLLLFGILTRPFQTAAANQSPGSEPAEPGVTGRIGSGISSLRPDVRHWRDTARGIPGSKAAPERPDPRNARPHGAG